MIITNQSGVLVDTDVFDGPFKNPYNTNEILWVTDSQMFAIVYQDTLLWFIPITNREALQDLNWLDNDYNSYYNFENAPVLRQEYFDAMKLAYYKYGSLTESKQQEIRQKIQNYFHGSAENPLPSIHDDTTIVSGDFYKKPITITDDDYEKSLIDQAKDEMDDIRKNLLDDLGTAMKEFLTSKPAVIIYCAAGAYLLYKIMLSKAARDE